MKSYIQESGVSRNDITAKPLSKKNVVVGTVHLIGNVYEVWTGHFVLLRSSSEIFSTLYPGQSQLFTVNGVSGKCVGKLSMGFLATS